MKRSHMLLLKANTEWIEKHEAGHTLPVHPSLWDLHPKNHLRRPVEGGMLSWSSYPW